MLPSYDEVIDDDDVISVGRLRLRTIHTPGHTPGSMCFQLEDHPILFSGDTLFPGGPGNTTFEGGDFATIIESLRSEEHTSELQSLMRISYAVCCLKKTKHRQPPQNHM